MLDVPPNLNFKDSAQGTSIHDHIVRLHDNGTIYGRTRRFARMPNNKTGIVPAIRAEITFIQNGRVVARTLSDTSGVFMTRDLTEGKYTLVAKHPEGIAVFGFTAKKLPPVTAKEDTKTSALEVTDELQPVLFQDDSDQEPEAEVAQFIPGPDGTELLLDVTLVPPPTPTPPAPAPEPVGGVGGFAGAAGGFGGGAAAGGGGLLGGLLLGGLGGALLLDDDDPKQPVNPNRTPITPDTP